MKTLIQLLQRQSNAAHDLSKSRELSGFHGLNLSAPLLRAISEEGYSRPTAIQAAAIPRILEGRDVLGCAQTGTGKTAAFSLPVLQRLMETRSNERAIRALVLTPTRELAAQVEESIKTYGRYLPLKQSVIFGGVGSFPQKRALSRRPDILVATPGRLLDLMQQGDVKLSRIEIFVLDEADRMLDMGFINDVRRVIKALPRQRQNLLFSATMPADVDELAMTILQNPVKVAASPVSSPSKQVLQSVYFVDKSDKRNLLLHVLQNPAVTRTLVFTRTKAIANRLSQFLCNQNIQAEAIHGNKSQSARQRALANFQCGRTPVLVASDLAARGIDVDAVSHVINFDLPNVAETYVHRIGRTGRGDASGIAISFCEAEERSYLKNIEKTIGKEVDRVEDHPFLPRSDWSKAPHTPSAHSDGGRRSKRDSSRRQGRSGRTQRGGHRNHPGALDEKSHPRPGARGLGKGRRPASRRMSGQP